MAARSKRSVRKQYVSGALHDEKNGTRARSSVGVDVLRTLARLAPCVAIDHDVDHDVDRGRARRESEVHTTSVLSLVTVRASMQNES